MPEGAGSWARPCGVIELTCAEMAGLGPRHRPDLAAFIRPRRHVSDMRCLDRGADMLVFACASGMYFSRFFSVWVVRSSSATLSLNSRRPS